MRDDTTVADLVIVSARCIATVDGDAARARRRLGRPQRRTGQWHRRAVNRRRRPTGSTRPTASSRRGSINAHHHLFQNLTRAYPADDRQAAVRLASVAVSAVAFARHRSRPTCRRGWAWPNWLLRAVRRRPIISTCTPTGRAISWRRRSRRHAISGCGSTHSRVDVAVGEGRRTSAGRRRGRRRRHPRRL